jgi:L-iditol 2-dehydrogenase
MEVRSLPLPELEPDSALLEVECSEICGTDVHLRHGRLAGVPYPIVPGHVAVGRLARIRGRIHDVHGRQLGTGERITFLDVHRTCNACWMCLVAKATTRCPQRRVYGITYGLGDGPSGGWATHLYLKPGTRCIGLEDLAPATFMAAGCALPTAIHVLERADVQLGDSVLVLGSGPVGLACIILACQRGAAGVLCIGAPELRLQCALDAGAQAVLDWRRAGAEEQLAWVREHTQGRGADVVLEASGDPGAVTQAMRCARDAGRVVVAGQYTDQGTTAFNPHRDLNAKHLDLRGCWGSDFSHLHRAAALLLDPRRRELWEQIPTRTYGLDALDAALDDVSAGNVVKALVDPRVPAA